MEEHRITFSLSLSSEDYLAYYRGVAKEVVVKSHDGRVLRFPANRLQPFLAHDGIHGDFAMRYDSNNKLISLEKLDK